MKQGKELLAKLKKMVLHKCDSCPKVYRNLRDLMKHMAYHEERFYEHIASAYVPVERLNLFICESCTQSFHTRTGLLVHKLIHDLNDMRQAEKAKSIETYNEICKPYKCLDCDYEFVSKISLSEHSIIHSPFQHVCECGIGYYELQDLKLHMELAHGTRMNTTLKIKTDSKVKPLQEINKGLTLDADLITKVKSTKIPMKVNLKHKNVKSKPKLQRNVPYPNIEIKRTPDGKFQCPQCRKTFQIKYNVYVHYRVHTGERPYSCDQCGSTFTQDAALKRHLWTHNTTEKYVCRHCSKVFYCPHNRARHELIHGDHKPYECPYCNKGFHDPSALVRHKRIHTEDMRYRCPYCPKAFTDVSALIVHKLRHENKKNFKCEVCKKRFYVRHELRVHMASHIRERNFCCDYCKQYYTSKAHLMMHIKRLHVVTREGKPYQCGHCYKKFISKKRIRKHVLLLHETKRYYMCTECNKGYGNDFDLRIHQLVHTDMRFECNDCYKKFFLKSSLLFHIRSEHTGIRCDKCLRYFSCKKYLEEHSLMESEQCEICDEEFFCKNMKILHLKEHFPKKKKVNQKTYECDYCKMCYFSKSNLFKHITGTHMQQLSCNVCFKNFYFESDFKKHKASEGCNVTKYTCDYCERSYRTKYYLKRHYIRNPVCSTASSQM